MGSLNTPYFIVHVASEFLNMGVEAAGKHFKAEKGEIKRYDKFIVAKLSVPVVNIIFALELLFKGLIKYAGKEIRGHNVIELFDALNPDVRGRIVDHYRSHNHYKKFLAIKLASGLGHSEFTMFPGFSKNESGIREILAIHQKHFVDFRYLFEYDDSNVVFVHFRELLNLTYSALFILGETQNVKIQVIPPPAIDDNKSR
jgi:hypothetical protein